MTSATQEELNKVFATAVELHQKGHLQQAQTLYRTILAVDSRHADALHLLGVAAHQQGEHAAAAQLIRQAIDVNRRVPQYHFNRGIALQALQEHAAAAECYRRAVQLKPDYASAWENLGVALQDAGDLDSARAAYVKALAIDGRAVLAHQNLGTLLLNLGRVTEARDHFRAVLAVHPAHAEAHSKYALTLLADGHYADGWLEYEWRDHSRSLSEHARPRLVPFPKWDGSCLAGKTLLISPEQGIGEELMFASCYPDAIRAATHCVIECDRRLEQLFTRSFPSATVIAGERVRDFEWDAALPQADFRIPAGSLPRFFRTELDAFPDHRGYLRVDPRRRAHWQSVLATLDQPINIGISWSGGREPRSIKARSIPLIEWQPIFNALDANFINLQYGQHAEEIAAFHASGPGRLHTLEGVDPVKDPDDVMALISALDLVISIDNSTVFMAGSVGTSVCILLPSVAEWRWRGAGDRSPWYPQAMLYRQERPGIEAWRSLVRKVAHDLPVHVTEFARTRPAMAESIEASAPARSKPVSPATASHGRALLVNDTRNWYHWGCSCTSLAIHSQLRRRWSHVDSLPIQRIAGMSEIPGSVAEFDDDERFRRFSDRHADVMAQLRNADIAYINGEGTLHGASPQAIGLLYLAYIAKRRLGRPVHIINHSCYPDDTGSVKDTPIHQLYRSVYREMDFVAVREPISAQVMSQLGIAVTESFDCLPLFVREHAFDSIKKAPNGKTVLIAGSAAWGATSVAQRIGELVVKLAAVGVRSILLIGADAHMAADDVHLAATLQRVASGRFQLLNATSELEWLRAIASVDVLVSGRFHHSIAAACLGTPFILMESNTPKIAGLLQRLESESFVSVSQANAADVLCDRVQRVLAEPESALIGADVRARFPALAERNFAG